MRHREEAPGTWVATHDIEAMLELRASDELAPWLAQRLSERFSKVRQRVLRVYSGRATRVKGPAALEAYSVLDPSLPEPAASVGLDAALLGAIRSRAPITRVSAPGGARLLAALSGGGEVRYVIELSGAMPLAGPGPDVMHFVSIVAKYFERLVDAETDPLTRLADRRVFHHHVDAGLRRWTGSGRPHFFAILDIDHFKRINDGFGHLYGDEILVLFANLMRRTFRAGDLLYRYGGEEFIVIYGVEPGHGGESAMERFRAAMQAYEFPGVGQVTVSAGFTRIADASTPAAILIDRADQALYYAKEHGRNRVCSWDALIAAGQLLPKATVNKDVTLF